MDMQCPFCSGPLAAGYTELSSGVLSFFVYGLSYLCLRFSSRHSDTFELELVSPGDRKESLGCHACGAVVVRGQAWIP